MTSAPQERRRRVPAQLPDHAGRQRAGRRRERARAACRRWPLTRAPRAQAKTRRGNAAGVQAPRRPRVCRQAQITDRPHRNFKLERLTSAKKMEMIQKRTMILGSGPPLLFEVVVDGRHEEDPPPGQPEAHDLDDDADRLEEEDPAEDGREELVLGEDGAHPEPAAERQRADVPHEHLRRVGVVPEEADAGADHGPAVDRELTGARDDTGCRGSGRRRSAARRARCRSGPARYAHTRYVPALIITGPIARPSRPSVRLTAFDSAITTKTAKATYAASGSASDVWWKRRAATPSEAGRPGGGRRL